MSEQTKSCPRCGKKLPSTPAKFCPFCGESLPATSVAFTNSKTVPAGYVSKNAVSNKEKDDLIDFGEAVKRFWSGYKNFSGRATRAEFWWAILFLAMTTIVIDGLVIILATIIDKNTYSYCSSTNSIGMIIVVFIWHFATFIPCLSVIARRFQDAGMKIQNAILSSVIGAVCGIASFVLCLVGLDKDFDKGEIIGIQVLTTIVIAALVYLFSICLFPSKK